MVHCNSMDHKIFRKAARVLSQHDTVYLPDSRDHGKSKKVCNRAKALKWKDELPFQGF